MLTSEQKRMRKTGIGGSDIAAIAGVNPWKSALDVYLDKMDIVEDVEENEAMEWGNRLEDMIAGKYLEGKKGFLLVGRTTRHPKHDFLLATPDRLFVPEELDIEHYGEGAYEKCLDKATRVVEIKTAGLTTSKLFGEEGTDEVPDYYLTQCQQYMEVMDMGKCDLAVLIAGQKYREYPIERNQPLIDRLVEIGEKFWFENVQAKVPPPAGASESAKKALALLYPKHVEDFYESNVEIELLVAELKLAKAELGKADTVVLSLENRIKELLQDKQGVITEAGKVTWRTLKDRLVTDWKGIVAEIEPDASIVKKFTTSKPGSRRFVTPRNWKE